LGTPQQATHSDVEHMAEAMLNILRDSGVDMRVK